MWGKGCIRFWGRLDQNSGFHGNRKAPLTYIGENDVSTFSLLFFIRSFLYLQVMRTCIKAWMGWNFGQIPLLTWELAALERLKNRCCHFFSVAINKSHFKFVGNEDIQYISDESQFRPDRTSDYRVNCP